MVRSAPSAFVSQRFAWVWQGRKVDIGYDTMGVGPSLILLPAFSTVSARSEMHPLALALGDGCRVIIPDWPGFGADSAPRLAQSPAMHLAFLRAFREALVDGPAMVVAAGHAAGYALALGPGAWTRIALIAPTWRGPLPTMMGGYRPVQAKLRRAIELPVIGQALYRLNIMRPVIAMMYRRHVYADAGRVTPAFVAEKTDIARRPAGRFGTAAFVTGGLDPMHDRDAFLRAARVAGAPIFVIYGADTPPRSRAEMEALAALSCVISKCLPTGSLGLYEENAAAVAEWLRPFLRGVPRHLGRAQGAVRTSHG